MNQPVDPLASNPGEPESGAQLHAGSEIPPSSPQESLPERIFMDERGVRLGWRLLLYFALAAATIFLLGWMAGSFLENARGATKLYGELYTECALLLAAILPAVLLARIEHRPFEDYGLPRSQAFGRLFWVGAVWGFVWITGLLLMMRGARVFEFGNLSIHGLRAFRFAAFWGVYFLIVALSEEFLIRGYVLFTLASRAGFWPSAVMLSVLFGAIHLNNHGETWVGALGAGLIGLFFCLTLRRTGSLWFAVGFHAAWDWGETFFYGVPDSGTIEPGHLLAPRFHGPGWLTGGTVGPEASALLLIVVAAMWLAYDRSYRDAKFLVEKPAA